MEFCEIRSSMRWTQSFTGVKLTVCGVAPSRWCMELHHPKGNSGRNRPSQGAVSPRVNWCVSGFYRLLPALTCVAGVEGDGRVKTMILPLPHPSLPLLGHCSPLEEYQGNSVVLSKNPAIVISICEGSARGKAPSLLPQTPTCIDIRACHNLAP